MKTRFITLQINSAGNIPATATCVDLHFHQNSIPPKINIDFTLDRYKVIRRSICTETGSEQVGSVQVLGAEVVHVGPIQMLGPKQNLSKYLDRSSTGPGSEQLRCLNSLLDALTVDPNELDITCPYKICYTSIIYIKDLILVLFSVEIAIKLKQSIT